MSNKIEYDGLFIPHELGGAGQLRLDGSNTTLKLVQPQPLLDKEAEFRDLHGTLHNGTKASLLECIVSNQATYRFDERARHETSFFPHYVLMGERFVASNDAVVHGLQYHFEDADKLINGYQTFHSLSVDPEDARKVLQAAHRRSEEIARKNKWTESEREFDPEIGENPVLLYFSGVWEILKCETDIATITFGNRTCWNSGSAKGIGIENEVVVQLDFSSPKTVHDACHALYAVHRLFELVLGRKQRCHWIEAVLDPPSDEEEERARAKIYWSMLNREDSKQRSEIHAHDVLVSPFKNKDEFVSVLKNWLRSNSELNSARGRFATAFYSCEHNIDRLVGAANMFDILPDGYVPGSVAIDAETKSAVQQSRKMFKSLPNSNARQSVLSALGRVGKASLRDKVCFRADIVKATDPELFADLHLPCTEAVKCRNYYVHGSEAAFDYDEEFFAYAFLNETLEFVFAVSDLIELGWDFATWKKDHFSLSHPFTAYLINYSESMKRLKMVLRNAKKS